MLSRCGCGRGFDSRRLHSRSKSGFGYAEAGLRSVRLLAASGRVPRPRMSVAATKGWAHVDASRENGSVNEIVDLASRLVATDSVNAGLVAGGAGEREAADVVAEWCCGHGFEVEIVG